MDIFQTVLYVGLIYRTSILCPQIHVHLVNSKLLRLKIETPNETLIDVLAFQKDVLWPGKVRVEKSGVIEVQFNKLVKEEWTVPYATRLENMSSIPQDWNAQILVNDPLTHDTSLVSFALVQRVYSFLYPGQYLQISNSVEGIQKNFTFIPLPMLPLRSYSYPNPMPEAFHSTSASIHVALKRHPLHTLSSWLALKSLGETVKLSNPIGDFCPYNYDHIEEVYFYTSGIGLRSCMRLIVWFLQTNRTVSLITFYRAERDILWHNELRSMVSLSESKFYYTCILSHASRLWRGKRGRPHYRWIDSYVKKANALPYASRLVMLSGQQLFLNITRSQLITNHGYDKSRVLLLTANEVTDEYLPQFLEDNLPDHVRPILENLP